MGILGGCYKQTNEGRVTADGQPPPPLLLVLGLTPPRGLGTGVLFLRGPKAKPNHLAWLAGC